MSHPRGDHPGWHQVDNTIEQRIVPTSEFPELRTLLRVHLSGVYPSHSVQIKVIVAAAAP